MLKYAIYIEAVHRLSYSEKDGLVIRVLDPLFEY